MTVLHIASKNDEVNIVEYLVEKGADVEEKYLVFKSRIYPYRIFFQR
jgi:ankyrin repeat protein